MHFLVALFDFYYTSVGSACDPHVALLCLIEETAEGERLSATRTTLNQPSVGVGELEVVFHGEGEEDATRRRG